MALLEFPELFAKRKILSAQNKFGPFEQRICSRRTKNVFGANAILVLAFLHTKVNIYAVHIFYLRHVSTGRETRGGALVVRLMYIASNKRRRNRASYLYWETFPPHTLNFNATQIGFRPILCYKQTISVRAYDCRKESDLGKL